ncbi:(deoxy)nucleoside triphosphate pyrophosphohydrolase [Bacillota bacterium Meth-B3]|nr:(deoxy)nucleoside triphosphate pyrophosphohydrolase [Christensenellaceae bacterium]MEA5068418.1 (deoxy)nucleoside triphosphate pyrophosphohydrolase [Christensenellaceae bacterium]
MARVVTAAVIEREGRVLLLRRASGQSHAGKWEFPGGKLEPGEDERACLRRELREELGIEARVLEPAGESLHRYERGEILLRAYWTIWTAGDMRLTVHDRARWASPAELTEMLAEMTGADVPIARRVAEAVRGRTEGE